MGRGRIEKFPEFFNAKGKTGKDKAGHLNGEGPESRFQNHIRHLGGLYQHNEDTGKIDFCHIPGGDPGDEEENRPVKRGVDTKIEAAGKINLSGNTGQGGKEQKQTDKACENRHAVFHQNTDGGNKGNGLALPLKGQGDKGEKDPDDVTDACGKGEGQGELDAEAAALE